MFGIGMPHLLLLAAIALIAIGPKQLPEVARVIGRFLNDLKRVRDEFTRTIVEHRDNVNQNFYDTNQSQNQNHNLIPPPEFHAGHEPHVTPPTHEAFHEGPAVDEKDQMAFDLSGEQTGDATESTHKKDS